MRVKCKLSARNMGVRAKHLHPMTLTLEKLLQQSIVLDHTYHHIREVGLDPRHFYLSTKYMNNLVQGAARALVPPP
jgi:hypothetical protein